jgi:hypothetical protein
VQRPRHGQVETDAWSCCDRCLVML